MTLFVFISDAWGAVSGGINCFNYELATACARLKKNRKDLEICCVVPNLKEEDQRKMQDAGIVPVTLSREAFDSPEAVQLISDRIQNRLNRSYPDNCNTFCVGHDIYSGGLSKRLAAECRGWNIVFHHMDYTSYYLLGKSDVKKYNDKINSQRTVLCDADLVCAVGPMLLWSAQDIARQGSGTGAIEVYPGLAEFKPLKDHPNRFNPIVFGRVEEDNQIIKQTPLAIDAFARAIAMDKDTPVIKNNPTLFVVGYGIDDPDSLKAEVLRLQKETAKIAGCVCNVVPHPYTADRAELGRLLCSASVAMMLSFHEGFGLVGYEAIAAGIPLILSKNTGLYLFLERQGLEHYVYPVDIKGSVEAEKYSEDDLRVVARALRDIRQNESEYKKKAVELSERLRKEENTYSWEAVADSFISRVSERFEPEMKDEAVAFLRPEEMTKLGADLRRGAFEDISIGLVPGKRVFMVKGKNALASLAAGLKKNFSEKYEVRIYNVQSEAGTDFAYQDFVNSCRSFFGRGDDGSESEFETVLGECLDGMILILDNFPIESDPDFENLFSSLNRQEQDFYVFAVFERNDPAAIKPYNRRNKPRKQNSSVRCSAVPDGLTKEQRLLVKVLAFREKMGYSKKLVSYICNGVNEYQSTKGRSPIFENVAEIGVELEEYGLIEEYSEYSYRNVESYLLAGGDIQADQESYALGLSRLGRFYAGCYYLCRDRDPKLGWGYFGCKCFSRAAGLSDEIKAEIKDDYEELLIIMRKKAMEQSDYERYSCALEEFVKVYEKPDDPWIWYMLIHCESICCPGPDVLEKVKHVLETEFSNTAQGGGDIDLYIQLIRLCAELENELDIPDSLEHLLDRIAELSGKDPLGVAWNQCVATVINLALSQKRYDLAEEYLETYRKIADSSEMYPKMIGIAMETDLKIARHLDRLPADLEANLTDIKKAYRMACALHDYRAQGWIAGLWGECQLLLKDRAGEGNLRKSMDFRKGGREKTKSYRNWLKRIEGYGLQPRTRGMLEEEMGRVGMCGT